MLKFALAGNPNSGKTTLFNGLTGSTAHVGNWPGVTVDKKEGVYKKCAEPIIIQDLPGIYSLSPYTPEEIITREYILLHKPDCLINIVDATNLERNLYLTTQIMEIDVPIIVALNMMDEVTKRGDKIDAKKLEKSLGVPVVEISALKSNGLDELMKVAYEASKKPRKGTTILQGSSLTHLINDVVIALEELEVRNPLFHAIKLIELDELEVKDHANLLGMIDKFKSTFDDNIFGQDCEAYIADSRYKYISKNYSSAISLKHREKLTTSDKIDRTLTHKYWGIPIFLMILFSIFHMTFTEDLFYLGKMGVFAYQNQNIVEEIEKPYDVFGNKLEDFYDIDGNKLITIINEEGAFLKIYNAEGNEITQFFDQKQKQIKLSADSENGQYSGYSYDKSIDNYMRDISIHTFFGYEQGIYSLGVVMFNTIDFATGAIGALIDDGLSNSAEWLGGFVGDGIWGGLSAVLSFLPQILLLFLFFSILEDSGYMARVAFILDRIFRKFGLSGRSFMPMIMGFGCSVPAIANTRTLSDPKERIATIRVIPFFSCGAKLPILTAISGAIVSQFGVGNADIITYSIYLLGILTALITVILMRNTTLKGEASPFIMELPRYHMPQLKSLVLHLWDKIKHFVQKAFTIIVASTMIIWVISHISFDWRYLQDSQIGESILAGVGKLATPLFTPLGFGSQLSRPYSWIFVVAAVTGLIAKENVIATFAVLAGSIVSSFEGSIDGVAEVVQMISATNITVAGLIAFIVFNMTTIPCFAAIASAKAELPNKRSYKFTLLFWVATSYILSMAVYLIGTFWWTAFIFLAISAVVIAMIVWKNKKEQRKSNIIGGKL